MHALKNIVGLLGAVIGIAYCGGLILYFTGSWGELGALKSLLEIENGVAGATAIGLGPTIFGLGVVGLVFVVVLLVRIRRLIVRRDPPPRRPASRPAETVADTGAAEADTMIAHYLAKRSTEAAAPFQAMAPRPAASRDIGPQQRRSFGRRGG